MIGLLMLAGEIVRTACVPLPKGALSGRDRIAFSKEMEVRESGTLSPTPETGALPGGLKRQVSHSPRARERTPQAIVKSPNERP